MIFCPLQIELLLRQDFLKEALEVAAAGTESFRDSVTMWQMRLRVLIDSESPDVAGLFEEAFVYLKAQVCELGLLYWFCLGNLLRLSQSSFEVCLSDEGWLQNAFVPIGQGSGVEEFPSI